MSHWLINTGLFFKCESVRDHRNSAHLAQRDEWWHSSPFLRFRLVGTNCAHSTERTNYNRCEFQSTWVLALAEHSQYALNFRHHNWSTANLQYIIQCKTNCILKLGIQKNVGCLLELVCLRHKSGKSETATAFLLLVVVGPISSWNSNSNTVQRVVPVRVADIGTGDTNCFTSPWCHCQCAAVLIRRLEIGQWVLLCWGNAGDMKKTFDLTSAFTGQLACSVDNRGWFTDWIQQRARTHYLESGQPAKPAHCGDKWNHSLTELSDTDSGSVTQSLTVTVVNSTWFRSQTHSQWLSGRSGSLVNFAGNHTWKDQRTWQNNHNCVSAGHLEEVHGFEGTGYV